MTKRIKDRSYYIKCLAVRDYLGTNNKVPYVSDTGAWRSVAVDTPKLQQLLELAYTAMTPSPRPGAAMELAKLKMVYKVGYLAELSGVEWERWKLMAEALGLTAAHCGYLIGALTKEKGDTYELTSNWYVYKLNRYGRVASNIKHGDSDAENWNWLDPRDVTEVVRLFGKETDGTLRPSSLEQYVGMYRGGRYIQLVRDYWQHEGIKTDSDLLDVLLR
jgi:hypothetical protein